MTKRLKLVVAIGVLTAALVATASALSRSSSSPKQGRGPDHATPTAFTFTGGTTTVGVSIHGNVNQFESPAGYEHIGIGSLSEGYVVCYTGPGGAVHGVDTGDDDNGVFGAQSIVGTSITRSTDGSSGDGGALRLKQTFTYTSLTRSLQIQNLLSNVSGVSLTNVVFRRQVDFDVDTGGANGWANFQNNFSTDGYSRVTAWNFPGSAPSGLESHSMALRHLSFKKSHIARVTGNILDDSCNADTALDPNTVQVGEDDGATLIYDVGTLKPGNSAKIIVAYDR
jgi:hypothetical protein